MVDGYLDRRGRGGVVRLCVPDGPYHAVGLRFLDSLPAVSVCARGSPTMERAVSINRGFLVAQELSSGGLADCY